MLTKLRTIATPATRGRMYTVIVGLVTVLSAYGVVADQLLPNLIALVGAGLTLVFAAINADSDLRLRLYAVLAPLQAILQGAGIFTDAQWASIGGLVAAVLGITLAAAKVPTE